MKFFKLFLFLLFITSFSSIAQQFRFKTTALSVLEKDSKNKWGKWSKPQKSEMYVTLDYDKNKIIIYSREIQHYTIVEYLDKEVTKTDEINSYLCKNQLGTPVKISFMTRMDQGNKPQLYVYFKEFVFCYDIIEEVEN
ncbi:hypothetical protein FLCU109888_05640 [Flavobacterium cucumis]|uniref:Uncharacterized protein n=1 Tax=Flavobacterium cucumis TaxID=416016 RepID=A0A1M7ZVR1_9FLAO|nr:hypothetical protein [Flavobacterium cucumis]SHO72946.1 hypothetical protein SAMN05443547_1292 [Flavobacterium cucumis]